MYAIAQSANQVENINTSLQDEDMQTDLFMKLAIKLITTK